MNLTGMLLRRLLFGVILAAAAAVRLRAKQSEVTALLHE
jgi:hypothetical protein